MQVIIYIRDPIALFLSLGRYLKEINIQGFLTWIYNFVLY